MGMGFANFGMKMLEQWGMNTSNRIGTGRSLRRQMQKEQVEQTRKESAAGIVGRVEGAKAAGVHPLVALGSNVGGAAPIGAIGPAFNSSGYDFGQEEEMQKRELTARKEELDYRKSQDATQNQLQRESNQNALEAQRLDNELRKAQIAAQHKQMADSDRDFAASQAALARAQAMHTKPLGSPIPTQYTAVRDRYGKIQYIPNPAIYDLELPESVGAGTLVLPERQSPWYQDAVEGIKSYFRKSRRNPLGLPEPVEP